MMLMMIHTEGRRRARLVVLFAVLLAIGILVGLVSGLFG